MPSTSSVYLNKPSPTGRHITVIPINNQELGAGEEDRDDSVEYENHTYGAIFDFDENTIERGKKSKGDIEKKEKDSATPHKDKDSSTPKREKDVLSLSHHPQEKKRNQYHQGRRRSQRHPEKSHQKRKKPVKEEIRSTVLDVVGKEAKTNH